MSLKQNTGLQSMDVLIHKTDLVKILTTLYNLIERTCFYIDMLIKKTSF